MGEREHRSTAKTVLVVMLIIELIIVLTIFMLTVVFSSKDSTPSFMGYSFYINDIDKMDDAVKVGSMVVSKNGRPGGSVVGGVILCENIDGFGTGIFRVVGAEATTDTFIYKVCLDGAPDRVFDIDAKNVIGECKYSYYTLGKLVLFVKSKPGIMVCVLIPALILALIELILGLIKEMKRRELQKKRETVKKEQAKRYSTKRKRDKAFSVDDFKNEDVDLKRKHLKNGKNNELRTRRAVRALSPVDDGRTKLMEIPSDKEEYYYDDSDKPYENKAETVRTYTEKPASEKPPVVAKPEYRPESEPEKTVAEAPAPAPAPVPEEQPKRPEIKKPSMSLEEIMALINNKQEKLHKDIEKNKTDV